MVESRSETDRKERRRRDFSGTKPRRLHVKESLLDRENWEYRWVNNTPGSIDRRIDEDWELVPDPENKGRGDKNASIGSSIAAQVGVQATGEGMRSLLMRKPKKYAEDDKARKRALIDKREQAMNEGAEYDKTVEKSGRRAA